MEPITTVGFGAIAAYLGKDSLQKLLGPTAEYLGEGLKEITKKRIERIGLIFKNAESKLGDRIDAKGEVPPKVLRVIINEGSFSNDTISTEYFGGILASSRTVNGRDDRGARISKMLDSLSTYQLRSHYLIYSTIRNLFLGHNPSFKLEARPKMQIFIPLNTYSKTMDFDNEEEAQLEQLLTHIFFGLESDSLIGDHFVFGGAKDIEKIFAGATGEGIICEPSTLGAELFLWAFGQIDKRPDYIFDSAFSPVIEGVPDNIPDTKATQI